MAGSRQPRANNNGSLAGDYVKCPTPLLAASDLSPAEKVLWLAIQAHCFGDTETCYPSVSRLATITGLKPRWTSDLLTSLSTKGYLDRDLRQGKPTVYRPKLPAGPMQCSAGVEADPCSTPHDTHAVECMTTHAVECTRIRLIETEQSNHRTQAPVATPAKKSLKPKPSPKKSKTDPDPRVRDLIDHFCQQHQQRYGAKYTVAGAKDGKTLKDLLTDHSSETLRTSIDAFFADTDPWLNGKRTIGVFRSRINTYIQQTAVITALPTPAAYRKLL